MSITLLKPFNIDTTANYTFNQVTVTSNVDLSGTAKVTLGNVSNIIITGGSNAQVLSTDGTGNLSWVTPSSGGGSNISNGTSNISIPSANGNILISVTGTANIASITPLGLSVGLGSLTRTNVHSNTALYVTSNISSDAPPIVIQNRFATGYSSMDMISSSNIFMGAVGAANPSATSVPALANRAYLYGASGASGVGIYATTGNVTISANSNANIMTITGTGVNVSGTLNVTSNANVTGNSTFGPVSILQNTTNTTAFNQALTVRANNGNNSSVMGIMNEVANAYSSLLFFNNSGVEMGAVAFGNPNSVYFANSTYLYGAGSNGLILSANLGSAPGNKNLWITNAGLVTIPGSTAASNTTSGAFQVTGGVGVGGNVYANAFYGNATGLTSIPGANVSGTVPNATYAVTAGTSNSVAVANVSGIGNIATINLNGNGSQVLAGNGSWVGQSSGSPGGSNTQLQFNNNGSFGGISTVTYDGANLSLGSAANLKITGGSNAQVLSTDGTGNLSWVTQSGGGGGSANIVIKNEGNILTNNVSSIDFVGSSVDATVVGNAVTVTVSGGGSGSQATITSDTFTGNGVQTAFVLSTIPESIDSTFVNIDGVNQLRNAYTVSGSTLTFTAAPDVGAEIEVTIIQSVTNGYSDLETRNYTGNGVQTTFTVTSGVTSTGLLVTENGVLQTPETDYTVSGANLVFVTAPASGVNIQVRELQTSIPAPVGEGLVYSRSSVTATAGQTSFAVAYSVGYLQVYFNGVLLNAADYVATTGSTIILNDAAAAGDLLEVITYNVVPFNQIQTATFNSTTLTSNMAITAGYSAVSVGPLTVADGVTISIAAGQKWVIL